MRGTVSVFEVWRECRGARAAAGECGCETLHVRVRDRAAAVALPYDKVRLFHSSGPGCGERGWGWAWEAVCSADWRRASSASKRWSTCVRLASSCVTRRWSVSAVTRSTSKVLPSSVQPVQLRVDDARPGCRRCANTGWHTSNCPAPTTYGLFQILKSQCPSDLVT